MTVLPMHNYNWTEIWETVKPVVIAVSMISGTLLIAMGLDRSNGMFLASGSFFVGSASEKIYNLIRGKK